eukprot:TRINITY_DN8517_c0_g3_i1.p1 TRINITY_DN8517_c0_g3~~TRINITY_DN8517_c0_g3_i1.p1  ORF type:complete len:535 (+),score=104.76 TRINITY_DN8517_c0_g3_i1:70-1674(+)
MQQHHSEGSECPPALSRKVEARVVGSVQGILKRCGKMARRPFGWHGGPALVPASPRGRPGHVADAALPLPVPARRAPLAAACRPKLGKRLRNCWLTGWPSQSRSIDGNKVCNLKGKKPQGILQKRIVTAGDRLTGEEIEAIDDTYCLLGDESSYMMKWNTKYVGRPMGPRDEKHRWSVRDGTKRKVVQELGLPMFGAPAGQATRLPPLSEATCLFLDGGVDAVATVPGALPGGQNLLGRYDIVVIRACADFDNTWAFKKGARNDFFVGHAAAINIGESKEASDFSEFCKKNSFETVAARKSGHSAGVICQLDVESYVEAMGRIIDNLVQACASLQIEHLVFFPFGMGAFLRHLGKLDDTFADDIQLQRLRRRLARRFVHAFTSAPPKMQVHLCLRFQDEESQRNADAFLRALVESEAAVVRSRLTIWTDADSLEVSAELAAKSRHVMLANGANRRLLGNHWFAGRAMMAIDENLHRRSWRMSALAYLLNGFNGQEPEGRPPNQLEQAVLAIRGRVCELRKGGRGASSAGVRGSR